MDQLELGTKIREFRTQKGLSIKALAEQACITPSMLSQIERNLANPSINTLKLISGALHIPLFLLFTCSNTEENVVVRKDQRRKLHTSGKNNGLTYELLTPNTNSSIEFVFQKFPPHSNSGDAVCQHDGEEVLYVINGSLTLTLNDQAWALHAGDSARIPALTPHLWKNDTDEDVEVIYAITPPSF